MTINSLRFMLRRIMVFSFVLKSLFTLSFNTAVMTMHDSFSPIPTMTSRDLGDTSPIIFQISIMHDLSPFEITFAASKKLDSFINSFFNWISRINKISGFLMMDLAVLMWSFLIVFTILWYSSDSSRDFSTASSNLFFFLFLLICSLHSLLKKCYLFVVPFSLVSPLLAEQTIATRFVLRYFLKQMSIFIIPFDIYTSAYGIISSTISFKNFPTLVPPYFWTIQGRSDGFDWSFTCMILDKKSHEKEEWMRRRVFMFKEWTNQK